jgi:hypothetical protein
VTLSVWLRLYATSTIGVLLLVQLAFPFRPLRKWLADGDHIAHHPTEPDGPFFVVKDGEPQGKVYASYREANRQLNVGTRLRAWLSEMLDCPWCTAAWVALGIAGGYAAVEGAGVLWWVPTLWLAAAATVVVLDAVAEA